MNIEKLPTDNLYKFIALGGLVLFLFGLGFILAFNFQIDELQIKEKNRIREASIKFGPLVEKEASLIRQMDYLNKIARRKYSLKSINNTDIKTDPLLDNIYDQIETMGFTDSKKDSVYSIIHHYGVKGTVYRWHDFNDFNDLLYYRPKRIFADTTEAFFEYLIRSFSKRPDSLRSLKLFPEKVSYFSAMDFKTLEEFRPLKDQYESLHIELETVREEIEINKEYLNYDKQGIELERDRLLKSYKGYYIVVFLGGALFIIGLIFWYLKTQKILDKKLKNESNFDKLFEYRYNALKELSLIYYSLYPKKLWEEMDEYEAFQNVSFNYNRISDLLKKYINEHAAILDPEEINAFRELELNSNDLQFEVNTEEHSVTTKGVDMSREVLNTLKFILDTMKNKFDKQYK